MEFVDKIVFSVHAKYVIMITSSANNVRWDLESSLHGMDSIAVLYVGI